MGNVTRISNQKSKNIITVSVSLLIAVTFGESFYDSPKSILRILFDKGGKWNFFISKENSFLVAVLSITALAKNVDRTGRFFRGAYTTTIKHAQTITSVVPSSCLQMEATLPPCRNIRKLSGFPHVSGYTIENQSQSPLDNQLYQPPKPYPILKTPALGWGEYFGFVPYTVTLIEPTLETITVQDPNVVVTFSVGGCQPSVIPMNIARCQPVPDFSIEEILPTSTIEQIFPTLNALETEQESYNGPFVEASQDEAKANPLQETEALGN